MLVPHRQGLKSPIAHFIFTYTMCRSPLPNGESQWSNTARLCVLFFLLLVVSVATSESVSIITLDITDGGTASTYLFHQTSSSTSALLTTDGLKELLSNPFTATTLTVTTAGAQQQMESTMAATPIGFFTGGIPNTLANVNGMLLVDPINLISGLHQSNNNFIYLFAVLEQQLYMAAYYCKNEHIKAADIRVLIRSSSNSGAISAAAKAAFAYYGIALPSTSLVASSATITDELLTTGFTFVVGLATSDVAPLVSFLDTQTAATVMVDFDDLTLLYDTFVTSFGTVVKPSMSRLLYATNLPRWNNVGVSRSIVDVMRGSPMTPLYARTSTDTLAAFYSFMPTAYHTPGGLRAYITALVVDAAAGSDIASTAALSDAMYGGTGVTVDGAKYGVFRNQCAAPSLDQIACKSNVGVKEQSLWSFASTLTGASPLFGPTASGYAPGADWEVGDNGSSVSVWLWGMLIVIGVMLLLLVLLAVMCLCASCGRRSSQSDSRQNRSRAEPSQVESANWKTSERGVPSAFYESEPFASCSNELGDSSLCVSVVLLEGGSLILCAPRELQEVLKEWGQLIHSLAQEHGLHVHSESSWELTFCCPSDVTITNFAETLHEQLCHVTFASIRPLRTAVLALHEPLSMNGTCGDNQEEPLFFFPLRTRISIARSLAPGAPTEHVWISRLHS